MSEVAVVTAQRAPFKTMGIARPAQIDVQAETDFWTRYLADVEAVPFPSSDGDSVTELKHIETRLDISIPFSDASTILSATWTLLVARYTDTEDVLIGLQQGSSSLQPLRCRLKRDQSIRDYLQQQRSHIDSIGSRTLDVDQIIALCPKIERASQFNDVLIVHISGTTTHAPSKLNYLLVIECFVAPDALNVQVKFSTNAIHAEQVDRLLGQFSHALRQIIDPDLQSSPIQRINLTSPQDMQKILQWRSDNPPEVVNEYVHYLIEEHVQDPIHAGREAVVSPQGSLTYSELDILASKIAAYIISRGIPSGSFIPLCFEKSMWAVVATFGVLKAGCAFVPLDPSHPITRLSSIIRTCKASLILTSHDQAEQLHGSEFEAEILAIDGASWTEVQHSSTARSPAGSSCPAYMICTSGSTGTPKGVVISHKAVSSSTRSFGKVMNFGTHTRAFQFASYAFDASIAEIIATLTFGGCVCIPSEHERLNSVAEAMRMLNVNWTFMTPSVARLLRPEEIPCLDMMVMGGEPLDDDVLEIWRDHTTLLNAYGPTECCVFCASHNVSATKSGPNNIGTAIGCTTWILDQTTRQPVPLGTIGELAIEGPTLASGYYEDEQRTNAAFIEVDLLPNQPPLRLYLTGDLARYNADGYIECLGRRDTQIKIRGNRIELKEIVHHLRQVTDYVDVMVDVHKTDQNSSIVAILANGPPKQDYQISKEEVKDLWSGFELERIKHDLADRMPSYMVPSIFVPLRHIPLSTSGKVDVQAIRKLITELAKHAAKTESNTALTDSQARLKDCWISVLRGDQSGIGPESNFFMLGGDSISAMRLVKLLEKVHLRLSVAEIFKHPTLKTMAAALVVTKAALISASRPFEMLSNVTAQELAAQCQDVDPESIEDAFPCTAIQAGMIVNTMKHAHLYTAQMLFRFTTDVDLNRLQAAWQQTADKIPILRTRIIIEGSDLIQVIVKEPIKWQTASNQEAALKMDDDDPMGLGEPLSRWIVITTPGAPLLLWACHHALYDGWSFGRIVDTATRIYNGSLTQDKLELVPYQNFVKYIQNVDKQQAKAFWTSQFRGLETVHWPKRVPNIPVGHLHHPTKKQIVLHEKGRDGFTAATLVRAAWSLLVSRYSDSNDIVFGAISSGRNAQVASIDRIYGPTLTAMPLRVTTDPTQSLSSLFQDLQDKAASIIPFEQSGLINIQAMSAEARTACEFRNLLIVQPEGEIVNKDVMAMLDESNDIVRFATYPLLMECTLTSDGAKLVMMTDPYVVHDDEAARIIEQFIHVWRELYRTPINIPLEDIDLLSPEDRAKIDTWNVEEPRAVEECIHHLIGKQIENYPNKTAIHSWDGDISYAELDHLSSKLAQHLIQRFDVGPKVFVPLCFEKSKWAIVAMIAVLKTGAAFAHLEHSHPQKRLVSLVDDLDAKCILVSESQAPRFGPATSTIILDQTSLDQLDDPSTDTWIRASPHDPAYLVYTSGTTGKPKATIIPHASYATAAQAHAEAFEMTEQTRAFQYSSYSFDIAIGEILCGLIVGGTICVPSETERRLDLDGAINRMRADYLLMTPTTMTLMSPTSVKSLRTVVCGGEPMPADLIKQWSPTLRLWNGYGPSECSVICAAELKLHPDPEPTSIGHAIGCRFWITEPHDHNRLAPVGAIGELLIEGPIVGLGYHNRPAATQSAIIAPPSWLSKSDRLNRVYKTGDLAQYLLDGRIKIIGRKDTQIKIRGQRVELDEIAQSVKSCLSVKEVIVDILTDPEASAVKHLVAFLSLTGEADQSSKHLTGAKTTTTDAQTQRLSQVLPQHMMPTIFIAVNILPMTTSGKVDRRALKALALNYLTSDLKQDSHLAKSDLEQDSYASKPDLKQNNHAAKPDVKQNNHAAKPDVKQDRHPTKPDLKLDSHSTPRNSSSQVQHDPAGETTLQTLVRMIIRITKRKPSSRAGLDSTSSLVSTGLDSITMISLARQVKQEFGISADLKTVLMPCTTIGELAIAIENGISPGTATLVDMHTEFQQLERSLPRVRYESGVLKAPGRRVFLTGCTGLLGSQILKHLLQREETTSVIVHVRPRQASGLQRVVDTAMMSGWWRPTMLQKLEVWEGDLSQARLGLTEKQWTSLTDCHDSHQTIDTIIHNGATVNWNMDYNTLKPANVVSTMALLTAVANQANVKLIYVSGGGQHSDVRHDVKFWNNMNDTIGYSQSKLMADQLLLSFADRVPRPERYVGIVRPGLIIGCTEHPVPNTDDFIWRMIATVVEIGYYSREHSQSWLVIASAKHVAQSVLQTMGRSKRTVHLEHNVLTGLHVQELWTILKEDIGYPLKPTSWLAWQALAQDAITDQGEDHPLWPVYHMLEQSDGMLGGQAPEQLPTLSTQLEVKNALIENVRYLIKTGFLPNTHGQYAEPQEGATFGRRQLS